MDLNEKQEEINIHHMQHIPITTGLCKMIISTNITQQAHKAKQELPNTFKEFTDIFQQKDTDRLPPSHPFDHAIQLEDSFTPHHTKAYPLNPAKTEVCKAFIDKHLKMDKSSPCNLHKLHHSSLSPKRTRHFAHAKITVT